jgi:hypothetical protein
MVMSTKELGPRMTELARPKINRESKLQTHRLGRESAPYLRTPNCQTGKIMCLKMDGRHQDRLADWLSEVTSTNMCMHYIAPRKWST